MKRKTFWSSTIAVIICLTIAKFAEPTFDDSNPLDSQNHQNPPTIKNEARVKNIIEQMAKEYQGRNKALLDEFKQKLYSAGNTHFQQAFYNINPFVNTVTTFGFCTKLCTAMVKDKFKHTNSTADLLAPPMCAMIIRPCENGNLEVQNALNGFLLKVQENDTQFKAGIAELLQKENFTVTDLGIRNNFLQNNEQLAKKIQSFAVEKLSTAMGAALEVIFIRSTVKCISKATATTMARLGTSYAVGGACAVADGPLPICDIIGGIIAVGGTVWTAHDIYKVSKVLPQQMRDQTASMIANYQKDVKVKAMTRAKEVVQLCDRSCTEIIAELNH